MDTSGAHAMLRQEFKCCERSLNPVNCNAAHEVNPELEARYAANRPVLARQFHFSPNSDKWPRLRSAWRHGESGKANHVDPEIGTRDGRHEEESDHGLV